MLEALRNFFDQQLGGGVADDSRHALESRRGGAAG